MIPLRQCFTLVKALAGLVALARPQAAVINRISVLYTVSREKYRNQWHRESNGFRMIPLRQCFTLVKALAGLVARLAVRRPPSSTEF